MPLKSQRLSIDGYEEVHLATDAATGLKAIIAIHNSRLGPACGGIRLLPYASEAEAMEDVLRLAKGMSYKSALAGIGFGGGKSVILCDPAQKTPALMQAFGEFVEGLNGRYIAAKDMNISAPDLREVKRRTRHVLGIDGDPKSSGDPSPVTARGILRALEATTESVFGTKDLSGVKVAIQGVGHVGMKLAEWIVEMGAVIWVADVNEAATLEAKNRFGATVVSLDEIYEAPVDVFSPCARGASLNEKTIPRLRAKAVVGCANNQLATPEDGRRLEKRGIVYAPDFAINSGGIISIFMEYSGCDEGEALRKADEIYLTTKEIFARAQSHGLPTYEVAERLAEERLHGKR